MTSSSGNHQCKANSLHVACIEPTRNLKPGVCVKHAEEGTTVPWSRCRLSEVAAFPRTLQNAKTWLRDKAEKLEIKISIFPYVVDQKALIVFKSEDDAILASKLIRRKFPKASQRCMYLSRIVPGETVPHELPWPDKRVAFKFDKHFKELFPVEVKDQWRDAPKKLKDELSAAQQQQQQQGASSFMRGSSSSSRSASSSSSRSSSSSASDAKSSSDESDNAATRTSPSFANGGGSGNGTIAPSLSASRSPPMRSRSSAISTSGDPPAPEESAERARVAMSAIESQFAVLRECFASNFSSASASAMMLPPSASSSNSANNSATTDAKLDWLQQENEKMRSKIVEQENAINDLLARLRRAERTFSQPNPGLQSNTALSDLNSSLGAINDVESSVHLDSMPMLEQAAHAASHASSSLNAGGASVGSSMMAGIHAHSIHSSHQHHQQQHVEVEEAVHGSGHRQQSVPMQISSSASFDHWNHKVSADSILNNSMAGDYEQKTHDSIHSRQYTGAEVAGAAPTAATGVDMSHPSATSASPATPIDTFYDASGHMMPSPSPKLPTFSKKRKLTHAEHHHHHQQQQQQQQHHGHSHGHHLSATGGGGGGHHLSATGGGGGGHRRGHGSVGIGIASISARSSMSGGSGIIANGVHDQLLTPLPMSNHSSMDMTADTDTPRFGDFLLPQSSGGDLQMRSIDSQRVSAVTPFVFDKQNDVVDIRDGAAVPEDVSMPRPHDGTSRRLPALLPLSPTTSARTVRDDESIRRRNHSTASLLPMQYIEELNRITTRSEDITDFLLENTRGAYFAKFLAETEAPDDDKPPKRLSFSSSKPCVPLSRTEYLDLYRHCLECFDIHEFGDDSEREELPARVVQLTKAYCDSFKKGADSATDELRNRLQTEKSDHVSLLEVLQALVIRKLCTYFLEFLQSDHYRWYEKVARDEHECDMPHPYPQKSPNIKPEARPANKTSGATAETPSSERKPRQATSAPTPAKEPADFRAPSILRDTAETPRGSSPAAAAAGGDVAATSSKSRLLSPSMCSTVSMQSRSEGHVRTPSRASVVSMQSRSEGHTRSPSQSVASISSRIEGQVPASPGRTPSSSMMSMMSRSEGNTGSRSVSMMSIESHSRLEGEVRSGGGGAPSSSTPTPRSPSKSSSYVRGTPTSPKSPTFAPTPNPRVRNVLPLSRGASMHPAPINAARFNRPIPVLSKTASTPHIFQANTPASRGAVRPTLMNANQDPTRTAGHVASSAPSSRQTSSPYKALSDTPASEILENQSSAVDLTTKATQQLHKAALSPVGPHVNTQANGTAEKRILSPTIARGFSYISAPKSAPQATKRLTTMVSPSQKHRSGAPAFISTAKTRPYVENAESDLSREPHSSAPEYERKAGTSKSTKPRSRSHDRTMRSHTSKESSPPIAAAEDIPFDESIPFGTEDIFAASAAAASASRRAQSSLATPASAKAKATRVKTEDGAGHVSSSAAAAASFLRRRPPPPPRRH